MLTVIIVATVCIVNLSLGLLVLLRKPKSAVSISFFLVSIFISLWAASNLLTSDPEVTLSVNRLFNRMAFFAAFLAVSFSLWFSLLFPRPVHVGKRRAIALTCLGAGVATLSLFETVAGNVEISSQGELHFTIGPLLPVYVITIIFFFVLIATTHVQTLRKTHGQTQQQALLILIAFAVPIVLGLLSNAVLPGLTSNWQSASIGPLFTIALVALISFAIIRHHLFDIRLALARSFAYILSIAAIATLYAILSFSISSALLGGKITVAQELFFASFSAVVALLFQPLKKFFDRVTNRVFYRDAYDAQGFVDQINRALVSFTDLNHLLVETATIIRDNFKAEYCLFGVASPGDKTKPLIAGSDQRSVSLEDIELGQKILPELHGSIIVTDNLGPAHAKLKSVFVEGNVGLLVHLTTSLNRSGESLGYLVVGNKKSGNPYNSQDIKMLDILANGMVIALQNAYRFEQIQEFNVTLQAKIDEATKKLRKTNERLRLLDQTKDDFISMASHQLRTPLTSIKGYVSMTLDGDAGKLNPNQEKMLTQAFLSAQRMVYLISDLLNVSRLKTGKFVIEPVESNLAKVIEEELEQLTETVKSRNLKLVYHKPEHFPTLMMDETKIRQVIMNFVDNAIYYTPNGGRIEVHLVDKSDSIEFTVVDNGIGVPKHEQHHLFSKFYRAKNAQSARPDGTGLGLFMAKKVVIAQGGAIIFRSAEGKGSTFGFIFPKSALTAKAEPPKPKLVAEDS